MKYKITAPTKEYFDWLSRFCEARPISVLGIDPNNTLIVDNIQRFELDMLKDNQFIVELIYEV